MLVIAEKRNSWKNIIQYGRQSSICTCQGLQILFKNTIRKENLSPFKYYLLMNIKQTKMIMIHIQKLQARLLYSDNREASTLRLSWLESATLDALSMFCLGKVFLEITYYVLKDIFFDGICTFSARTKCIHIY